MEEDEADLALERASKWAITRLRNRFSLLEEAQSRNVLPISASGILSLLDIFQEDPQQLDLTLKEYLPLLVQKYMDLIQESSDTKAWMSSHAQSREIAKILAHLCKVRGVRIVSTFLKNEPKYIEPILNVYERIQLQTHQKGAPEGPEFEQQDLSVLATTIGPCWQEEYIILLWLGHLMLTPFDLATISAVQSSISSYEFPLGFKLEFDAPSIANKIIMIALPMMAVADKRQFAAASMLVRLVTRPDSIKLGLLKSTARWALDRLELANRNQALQVHEIVGLLSFLNGIVSSAEFSATTSFFSRLLEIVTSLVDDNQSKTGPAAASAVEKRIAIKIQRNIVLQSLTSQPHCGIDVMTILEDVIDFLLRSLKDRDTQVRKAASKALSVITTKVDPGMAEDIVEAVLGSLNEDVLLEKGTKNMQAVSPLRWHGLTLTLSQMLFRRSPTPTQIPSILDALFSALAFEQRSAAGSSIGGNVRDAANFGLWSLARRYTTLELKAINLGEHKDLERFAGFDSVIQLAACHLLSAACLDPIGNVRRGSSAALQELIGRHPDTVFEGISLVQTVDYQGVGLLRRAMTEIAFQAATLHSIYIDTLLSDFLTWRGIGALDKAARDFAGYGLGRISTLLAESQVKSLLERLILTLSRQARNEVEAKHGLIFAMSCIVQSIRGLDSALLNSGWHLFTEILALQREDLASVSLRPQLISSAVLHLLTALAENTKKLNDSNAGPIVIPENIWSIFNLCLLHIAESDYKIVRRCTKTMAQVHGEQTIFAQIEYWLKELREPRKAYRVPALMIALGAIWAEIDSGNDDKMISIIDALASIASNSEDIEAKIIAVKSLGLILEVAKTSPNVTNKQCESIMNVLDQSLNDYTINERGDVGSLLRGEALSVFHNAYELCLRLGVPDGYTCLWGCYRLATEKLHKVRVQASQCLMQIEPTLQLGDSEDGRITIADVSSYRYFHVLARRLSSQSWSRKHALDGQSRKPTLIPGIQAKSTAAILEGFSSTAGTGPDDVLQLSRCALLDSLEVMLAAENESNVGGVVEALLSLVRDNLTNERTLVPALELWAFLLDAGTLERLFLAVGNTDLMWAKLFALVQKAHFKSKSLPKLLTAIHIYRSLCTVSKIQNQVIGKLAAMLSHPFPKIRLGAAEALWTVTGDETLKTVSFTKVVQSKAFVDEFRAKHCST